MTSGIELRYLRSFVVLAEELHFGRAAARLGISQPPLSAHIVRLEQALGCPLFVRRPAVRLTAAGEALLDHARRVVRRVEQGAEAARRVARGESGRLRVGFAASTLLALVPTIIRRFVEERPEVDLVLRELPTAEQVEALRSGDIDVGFLREPPEAEDLESTVLMRESFLAVLPAAHPLAERRAIPIAALAEEPFVHFPRRVAPTLHDQVAALCRTAGFAPRVVQEALEWLTIVGLVEAGLGVSLVPASFGRLRWGDVRYVALRPAEIETATAICLPRNGRLPAADGFLEVALHVARKS